MVVNKTFIGGNICSLEMRQTGSGTSVLGLRVAVNEKYTTKAGESKEETLFIDVTVWGKIGEVINRNLSKGDPIYLEGRLKTEEWLSKEGEKRSKISMVASNFSFCGGKAKGSDPENNEFAERSTPASRPAEPVGFEDDDIPF